MEQDVISVIVPVYNTKAYLRRCVDSLCAQTYENLEILLVDDGSTDGSGALCEELAGGDGRIRVIHKQNGGSSSARNMGIAQAKGAFLGFVDSDDFVEPEMYEALYRAVCTFQVPLAQIGRDELDENGNRLPDICVPPDETERIGAEAFMKELLLHRGDCSFCTKLIKRELLEEIQFPLGVLNEDFHLLVQLLPRIKELVSLPRRGYHVFCRMDSNTRKSSGFSRVFADNVDNADMVAEIVREYYPTLGAVAFRFGVFQRLDYMLHIPIEQMKRQNAFYRKVVRYLRKNWLKAMGNPYLTGKNKRYHTIFALAPAMSRKIHAALRRGRA